jgi:homoserine kinase type II
MDSDLTAVLAGYPAAARPWDEPEPLGNAGGASGCRLWRFRSGLGTLVARAWPEDGPDRSALEAIHAWLAEAGPLGFVPVPLAGLDGRTARPRGGRLWEVAPWMPGEPDTARPATATRVRAGFAALAAFHQRLAHRQSERGSPGLAARLREVHALLGGGFDDLRHILDRAGPEPLVDLGRAWVEAARPAAPFVLAALSRASSVVAPIQPCLRDARPEHFLFRGESVTGLVDFGAMGLDSVAADLARLLQEWVGRDLRLRDAAIDAYTAVRPLSPSETLLIGAFEDSAALLGGGHWLRWHFVDGRTFDDPEAVSRGLRKGLDRAAGLRGGG